MKKLLNPWEKIPKLTRSVAFTAIVVGGLAPLGFANANIIDTTHGAGAGSFELGAFVNNGNGFMPIAPGGTTITGWTVGGPGDGVDWLITPSFAADIGTHSVDLEHLTNSSISTVIPTVTGQVYELTFGAAAVDIFSGSFPGDNLGKVSAGSLLDQAFAAEFSSQTSNQVYTQFSFLFTALDSTTSVEFMATGPDTAYGPVLDSVSVSAVPLPAAIWLFGSGLIGLIGMRRKSSKITALSA